MTTSSRYDCPHSTREGSDPLPAIVMLIFCPPVAYASSSWAAQEMALGFSACPAGGLVSSDHITGTAAATVLAALIPFVADLLTASWGLLIVMLGLSALFGALNENTAVAVRRMAGSSAMIFSLLALAPLVAGRIACL